MKPITLFIASVVLFIGSEMLLVYLGFVKIYFLFFIPIFVSSSVVSLAPFLLFLIPIVFFFLSNRQNERFEEIHEPEMAEESPQTKKDIKYGGLIMVGPIPILFGKGISNKVLIVLAILTVILIITWFIFAK